MDQTDIRRRSVDLRPLGSSGLPPASPPEVVEEPVALPVAPEPSRPPELTPEERARHRRRQLARRRIGAASLLALMLIGLAVGISWLVYGRGDDAATEAAPGEEGQAPVVGWSALVLAVDESGRTASAALFAASPDQPSRLVLLPSGWLVRLPGYDDQALADATRFEGPELSALAVGNALGVRVDAVSLVDRAALEQLADPGLEVELPVAFIVSDDEGGRVVLPAGPATVDAPLAARLLLERGAGSQPDWLQRQAAVWLALVGHVDSAGQERLFGESEEGAEVADAVAGDSPLVSILPVSLVASSPDAELYTLGQTEAEAFTAERLGYVALAPAGERLRVEVLNGNGRVGSTRPVAEQLILAGYHVVKTGNADSPTYQESLVVAQGNGNQAAAIEIAELLGAGEAVLDQRASGVVDVSIIVGADIAARESRPSG